ncbi:MAG: phosphate ABC transporter substrate-binding protein [Oscillospiraceae bacterium]|nr:phosphate ABC transporter substrate-binding protein [Oscillospiraceae bacterium]
MKHYIQVGLLSVLLLSVNLLSSCMAGKAHGGLNPTTVIVAGSTSVQPYVEILVEEYRLLYPDNAVGVQGGGSSAGIRAVLNEIAEIGMSSRALNQEEKELGLWSVEIALDGLAIVVHPDNKVENLTMEQVRDIYSRKITNWSEVNGEDRKIHIISREEGSGTRSAFQDLVMGDEMIAPRAIVQNSNGAVRQLVSSDRNAIGFISLGLAEPQPGLQPVKALNLDGFSPTQENVLSGEYELYRAFLFISEDEPTGAARHFVSFVLSEEGQRILSGEGLIPAREMALTGGEGVSDEEV